MTHFYVSKETISKMESVELQNILSQYIDAYKAGAGYPDSGYIGKNTYGEDSHWDPFINTFADYIRTTYPNPEKTNPKLVAFLMGVAIHSISDILWHWPFIGKLADNDVQGQWEKAHTYANTGLDMVLLVDKKLWREHPLVWWIPADDLVKVYERMGFHYTKEHIIRNNIIYYLVGISERIIALPASWHYKRILPWGINNYITDSDGGINTIIKNCADYNNKLWHKLTDLTASSSPLYNAILSSQKHMEHSNQSNLFIMKNILNSIENGTVGIKTTDIDVGVNIEVNINQKMFNNLSDYQGYLD